MPNGGTDWQRYWKFFENDMWMDSQNSRSLYTDSSRDTATVNTVGSICLSYQPYLVNGDIRFKLRPRKPGDVVSAQIQESLLNYSWEEAGCTAEVKKAINDLTVIGHCVLKSGYVLEVDESRKSDETIEYRDYIRRDAAFIQRLNPMDFLFDLGAPDGSLRTARWAAERTFIPYNDLLVNDRWDKEVVEMIQSGAYNLETRIGFDGMALTKSPWGQKLTEQVPEDTLVELWTVHDKKFKKVYTYASGVPWPLEERSWDYPYLDGFPFTKIDFIPVSNKPYGMGLYRLCEDQSFQENLIRSQQFQHIRAHKQAYQAMASVHPDELTKFTDGPDGTVFVADTPDAIKAVSVPPMSQDFERVEQRIKADISHRTGQDELAQGGQLQSRTTASEIGTRVNLLKLKTADRVWAVEQGVTELARQTLQHLKANRTLESVIEIVGAQGAFWKTYSHSDIQAEVDCSVEYFAAPKYDPALDRQQKLQILQLAVQAMPAMQQAGAQETIDMVKLLGWVLKGFDVPDAGIFFKPALIPQEPLVEQQPGAGSGLPPAIAGGLAPTPIPEQPNVDNPGEGLELADLMQQMRGSLNN
jgi:hypothetical protein